MKNLSDAARAFSHLFDQLGTAFFASRRCFLLRAEPLSGDAFDWQRDQSCVQSFRPTYDRLHAAGYQVTQTLTGAAYDLGICFLTKHKLENLATLAQAWQALRPGGTLFCVGGKDVGIGSIERVFKGIVRDPATLSKHHCKILWGQREETSPPILAEWSQAGQQQMVAEIGAWSQPGIFGWNKIDAGSALLVDHLPADLHGQIADLGAGWGYLSLQMAARWGDRVSLTLFEAEWLALEAARRNLDRVPPSVFHWHDVTQGALGIKADYVVMNPPFHEGKFVDIALGQAFIETAAQILKPRGRLFMVANRQLPYEDLLQRRFRSSVILAETALYKIISAQM